MLCTWNPWKNWSIASRLSWRARTPPTRLNRSKSKWNISWKKTISRIWLMNLKNFRLIYRRMTLITLEIWNRIWLIWSKIIPRSLQRAIFISGCKLFMTNWVKRSTRKMIQGQFETWLIKELHQLIKKWRWILRRWKNNLKKLKLTRMIFKSKLINYTLKFSREWRWTMHSDSGAHSSDSLSTKTYEICTKNVYRP